MSRWALLATLGGACWGLDAGCGADLDVPDASEGIDVSDDQVERILSALFPDLTDAEIRELATNLSLDAMLSLKAEIEEIREVAAKLSRALFTTAEERIEERSEELEPHNGGFPTTLEPVGLGAFYDAQRGEARIELSGVFSGQSAIRLAQEDVRIELDGTVQPHTLACLADGTSVDIVFLVDITGSMSPVIGSVRRSLLQFVEAIVESGIRGTIGVVTFQDSVGVNVSFQEPAPASGFERSPFFEPVPIDDPARVEELSRFITRLEANSGMDAPENLSGAVDFARNNVIGLTARGAPNVIGDGKEDVPDVSAWPALESERQVFVAFTDAPFHADSRDPRNSSLVEGFEPRPIADIVRSLHQTATTVHVSDPSWVDGTVEPSGDADEVQVDSDLWALETGGLGVDHVLGYSLVDLDLVVVAEETGLLDIVLDGVLGTTCTARVALASLPSGASLDVHINHGAESFSRSLTPVRF